jgi:ketosteroid isomerase-like protein
MWSRVSYCRLSYGLASEDPRCFEEGSVGWVVDRPTFVLADSGSVPSRMTAVMRQEDGEWNLVHTHWSVGVSNQEAFVN